MSKKNIITLIISIALVICALTFFVWSQNNYNEKEYIPEENNIVIDEESKTEDKDNIEYGDFVFYRRDKTEVSFEEFKDKPTMLMFWNPDNEDSVEDLKKVDSMYEKYKDDINFIMICTAEEVDEKIESEVSIEIYYDFYKAGQRRYDVTEVPTLIYITKDNEIFNAKVGFTTTDALEANLDLISNNI